MQEIFFTSFWVTFLAVLKIFFIIIAAGLLVRKNYISQDILKGMASSVVKIFLPCLIFSNIVKNFDASELRIWPLLPISAILMMAVGIGFGALLFIRELPAKKNMLSLTSMQNAGYFILPLGAVLFSERVETFNLYCFLFFLGVNPIVWSVGKYFITESKGQGFSFSVLKTPPLIASVTAILLVFTELRRFIPPIALESVNLLGRAAVPIAIFILGGMLGSVSMRIGKYLYDGLKVSLVKLVILPVVTIVVLYFSGLNDNYPMLCSFLVLEAAVAPATANLMQVKHYGGEEEKISSITLICYGLSIITVPLSLALWNMVVA